MLVGIQTNCSSRGLINHGAGQTFICIFLNWVYLYMVHAICIMVHTVWTILQGPRIKLSQTHTSSLDQITFRQELCSKASCWQIATKVFNFSSTYFCKPISYPFFDNATRTYVAYHMKHIICCIWYVTYHMLYMIWWNVKSKLWSGTIFCTAFNDIPIAEAFITSYYGSMSNVLIAEFDKRKHIICCICSI